MTASQSRITADCPVYGKCGGCQLRHVLYEEELNFKRQIAEDALKRIGNLQNADVPPVIGGKTTAYRNKMQFPVGRDKDGNAILGGYAPRSHNVVETMFCAIQSDGNNAVLNALSDIFRKIPPVPYDETTQAGELRHVLARDGDDGQIAVVFVTKRETFSRAKEIVAALVERVPQLVGVWQNVNGQNNNVILGKKNRLLYGKEKLLRTVDNGARRLTFAVSPTAFFQVNAAQAAKLFELVEEFAALTGNETVLDLYCGTGTIALFLAHKAKKIIGLEIVPSAIADAKENARLNGVENAKFICGDAAKFCADAIKSPTATQNFADVVILDPPRAGAAQEVLTAVLRLKPRRVVYVSCNIATFARDAKELAAAYRLERVRCVDMFPRTVHVETVGVFELKI